MKRLNNTAIAMITVAALGLGTAPMAQAQDVDLGLLGITPDKTGEGATYAEQANDPVPLPSGLVEQPGPTAVVGDKTTEGAEWVPENAPKDPAPVTELKELSGTQEPAASNSFNRPKATATVTETMKPTPTTTVVSDADKDRTRAIVLGTLGAAVGLGLVIAGVKYFVNKDGDLVKDKNRVNEPATPAEKEESDRLKKENADEIAKQLEGKNGAAAAGKANGATNGKATSAPAATTANGERGMAATTGVVKLPAGLIALLILAIVSAAGYAFTRRETA